MESKSCAEVKLSLNTESPPSEEVMFPSWLEGSVSPSKKVRTTVKTECSSTPSEEVMFPSWLEGSVSPSKKVTSPVKTECSVTPSQRKTSHKVYATSSKDNAPLGPQESRGLTLEFFHRGFRGLPWINEDNAPPVIPLQHLGEGTYGTVDLVDCGGQVLVRKQFHHHKYDLGEAYALMMLQGAGGTPILKGMIKKPLTIFMTLCGKVTLREFLKSRPRSKHVLQVLLELSVKVGEMHAKGLVHLDLKDDNVMVQRTEEDTVEVQIIDVGLAALPGQRIRQKQDNVHRFDWICPQVLRRGPITFAADVYSLGRLMARVGRHLQAHPAKDELHMLATQALAENPHDRPTLETLITELQSIAQ